MVRRSDGRGGDHFDGAGVFGTGLDHEGGGADESVEERAFFESDRTGAIDLPPYLAINGGGDGGDWIEKLDPRAFFDSQVPALDRADDLAVAADDEVARAFDRSGEFA